MYNYNTILLGGVYTTTVYVSEAIRREVWEKDVKYIEDKVGDKQKWSPEFFLSAIPSQRGERILFFCVRNLSHFVLAGKAFRI